MERRPGQRPVDGGAWDGLGILKHVTGSVSLEPRDGRSGGEAGGVGTG